MMHERMVAPIVEWRKKEEENKDSRGRLERNWMNDVFLDRWKDGLGSVKVNQVRVIESISCNSKT